jgi:hypothetical protein
VPLNGDSRYEPETGASRGILREIVEIIEKLSQDEAQVETLVATHRFHLLLTPLIQSRDYHMVEAVLLCLLRFSKCAATKGNMSALNAEECVPI